MLTNARVGSSRRRCTFLLPDVQPAVKAHRHDAAPPPTRLRMLSVWHYSVKMRNLPGKRSEDICTAVQLAAPADRSQPAPGKFSATRARARRGCDRPASCAAWRPAPANAAEFPSARSSGVRRRCLLLSVSLKRRRMYQSPRVNVHSASLQLSGGRWRRGGVGNWMLTLLHRLRIMTSLSSRRRDRRARLARQWNIEVTPGAHRCQSCPGARIVIRL